MNDIVKYEIINPIADKSKPYYRSGTLYIPIETKYKYFLETRVLDENGYTQYYFLFGKEKFNKHCRKCQSDSYGKIKLRPKGEIKEYIHDTCKSDGNIELEYIESTDTYDVFMVL
ncbi:MAG: hypothetical protein KNU04_gp55 [crAssphage sp. isolate ctbg_1]|uniref:Uncharacterized protein n=1 Tax=crAssphage sp. isolate ctbg_1 TaxID=2989854 RepID=A0A345MT25_9CAUD|nr:MAG: hypothetical protein KNU04_gp55 [crAssphage sp. isolate ctbg_1]AXH74525.1 MAG: hypothetical protein [crAssphage sp. isolate ctbg_1]